MSRISPQVSFILVHVLSLVALQCVYFYHGTQITNFALKLVLCDVVLMDIIIHVFALLSLMVQTECIILRTSHVHKPE